MVGEMQQQELFSVSEEIVHIYMSRHKNSEKWAFYHTMKVNPYTLAENSQNETVN